MKRFKKLTAALTAAMLCLGIFGTLPQGFANAAQLISITTAFCDDTVVTPTEFSPGIDYTFTVSSKNGGNILKVAANGEVLTANKDGKYTVKNAPENTVVYVENSRDKYSPKDGIWNGKSVYMRSSNYYNPSWNSEMFGDEYVTRDEAVMFYKGRTTAKLQFPIDNIVCVNSYNLDSKSFKQYYLGEDFTVNANGEMALTANTKIPVYSDAAKLKNLTSSYGIDWGFIAGMSTTQPRYLVTVTYTHTRQWKGTSFTTAPKSQSATLKFKEKAENGETVNVLFMGDSITTGCNATGQDVVTYAYNGGEMISVGSTPSLTINGWKSYLGLSGDTAPEWTQKAWPNLVVENLQSQYPDANFTLTNRGIGSSASEWYYNNINAIVNKKQIEKPDLVFIAFGMNEANRSKDSMVLNVTKMKNYIRSWNPDCTVVLVSPFHPNAYTENAYAVQTCYNLEAHEQGYKELSATDSNIAYAPVLSEFKKLLTVKEGVDYTGNNYNHVNDFGVNLYANTILATISPTMHTVTFVDKSGVEIGKVKVESGKKIPTATVKSIENKLEDIFGYKPAANCWTGDVTQPITSNKTFTAVYTRVDIAASLTVNDYITNYTKAKKFDERITLTASQDGLNAWLDGKSAVCSTDKEYSFNMSGDTTLTAMYNSTAKFNPNKSILNVAVHYNENVALGYNATVTAQTHIPLGAKVVEQGFIVATYSGYKASNGAITDATSGVQVFKARNNERENYMMTININNGQKRYIRSYVKYSYGNQLYTEYSKYTAEVNCAS